jgi:hypothetical protein
VTSLFAAHSHRPETSMTSFELLEIVNQRLDDPAVLGRLATNLYSDTSVHQRHKDDRTLTLSWHEHGDMWRCTVWSDQATDTRLAQIDIHENSTTRIDVFEPCRVTISPHEGMLCLTRYKPH